MDEKRQIQKELFEEFVGAGKRRHPKGIFRHKPKRTISLSYEHLIFITIAFIIAGVVSFSVGVEKGKRAAAKKASLLSKDIKQHMPVQVTEIAKKETETEAPLEKEEFDTQRREPTERKKPYSVYTIRVASYLKEPTAEREAERLKKKGFKPFVLSSGKYYVVCVGEFKDKEAAYPERKRLRKLYHDCYIGKR